MLLEMCPDRNRSQLIPSHSPEEVEMRPKEFTLILLYHGETRKREICVPLPLAHRLRTGWAL